MTSGKRPKIWATLDDYLAPGSGFQYVGRNIANHNFFRALIKYGHFDEYHFFLANSAHKKLFETSHMSFLEEINAVHKVKLYDRMALPDLIQQYDYTVFHQSDHVTLFNSLCHIRNRIGSFPITAFIHSLSYQRFMGKYLEMFMGGVTSGDAIICSSAGGKHALQNCFEQISERLNLELPPVSLEVIPLGFEGSDLIGLDPHLCRKELGIDDKDVIGLCFGRFSDHDKMDLFPLVQAFKNISGENQAWRLILAGGSHSDDYVRILQLWSKILGIDNKITIMTNVSDKDKKALYRASDFFISVSDNPQETFGLTLLEAMACELPLVVSDYDGYKEIVTDEVGKRIRTTWSDFKSFTDLSPIMDEATFHRYLAQSLCVDVTQLSEALKSYFSNPEMRMNMGRAARERFLECFDCSVVIRELEELWLRLKSEFCQMPDSSHIDPLNMNVFDSFSHYITQKISPDMRVKITPYGREMLASGLKYPLLPEMDNLIDHEEIKSILLQTQKPLSVEDILVNHFEKDWKKRYQILWMLKHDLLQIIDDRESVPFIQDSSTDKPRILYILHQYHNLAGTEKHTKTLAAGLKEKYDIRIVFPHHDQICVIDSDKNISSFPATPVEWPVTRYTVPQTEESLSRILDEFNPDIIHIQHFIHWPLSVIDRLIQTGKPVVMSFHDYYTITPNFTMQGIDDPRQILLPGYAETIFKMDITDYLHKRLEIITRSLANLRALITPSTFLARELSKIFPLDFRVIEHGISPFEPLPSKRNPGLCFGYVGSLLPQKGWDLLARAFIPIHRRDPSAELHFYGNGQRIDMNNKEGIFFHGPYDQQDLPRIFAEIDVGFIPSIFKETYCLALSEMWLARLPVAVSDIGALGERVINNKTGIKFIPGDIDAMTDAFFWFLENDGWNSWDIPAPRLVDDMLKEYEELYDSLLI